MIRTLRPWVPAIAALLVLLSGCEASARGRQQEARLTSSGDYKARNLASNAATVRVSSSGSATLRVSDSLEANITSSGSVRYYGSPPKVSGNVTSSGRLIKAGD